MPTPIVIDCDPGHDDAVAILLALGSDRLDLRGITTTYGNCSLEQATDNALRVLALAGHPEVPVAAGAAAPMHGDAHLAHDVHGPSGLDGAELPEPESEPVDQTALDFLARQIEESPEPLTLVATGPMTNAGTLLGERPDLREQVREVVFMGGSADRGNHTPVAEFNSFCDPEALDLVLRSGVPVRMVGLNLTHQALATDEQVARMRGLGTRLGRTCADWMTFFGDSYRRLWEFPAPPVHDPCAVAALIDPDVISWRESFVAVELDGTWTRGTTMVDLHRRHPGHAPNARVGIRLDAERFWQLVVDALAALAGERP